MTIHYGPWTTIIIEKAQSSYTINEQPKLKKEIEIFINSLYGKSGKYRLPNKTIYAIERNMQYLHFQVNQVKPFCITQYDEEQIEEFFECLREGMSKEQMKFMMKKTKELRIHNWGMRDLRNLITDGMPLCVVSIIFSSEYVDYSMALTKILKKVKTEKTAMAKIALWKLENS